MFWHAIHDEPDTCRPVSTLPLAAPTTPPGKQQVLTNLLILEGGLKIGVKYAEERLAVAVLTVVRVGSAPINE